MGRGTCTWWPPAPCLVLWLVCSVLLAATQLQLAAAAGNCYGCSQCGGSGYNSFCGSCGSSDYWSCRGDGVLACSACHSGCYAGTCYDCAQYTCNRLSHSHGFGLGRVLLIALLCGLGIPFLCIIGCLLFLWNRMRRKRIESQPHYPKEQQLPPMGPPPPAESFPEGPYPPAPQRGEGPPGPYDRPGGGGPGGYPPGGYPPMPPRPDVGGGPGGPGQGGPVTGYPASYPSPPEYRGPAQEWASTFGQQMQQGAPPATYGPPGGEPGEGGGKAGFYPPLPR